TARRAAAPITKPVIIAVRAVKRMLTAAVCLVWAAQRDNTATTSSVPRIPERSIVPLPRSSGRRWPLTRTARSFTPWGRRSRSRIVCGGRRDGTTTVPVTWLPSRCRSYVRAPKLVGAPFTEIDLPSPSHGRGAAKARSRPTGEPSLSRRSWTSISRSVSRNAELLAVFGGMYIDRYEAPRSGATVAASPETNVFGVIEAPSMPYRLSTSWSGRSLSARNRAKFSPYTWSVPDTGYVGLPYSE